MLAYLQSAEGIRETVGRLGSCPWPSETPVRRLPRIRKPDTAEALSRQRPKGLDAPWTPPSFRRLRQMGRRIVVEDRAEPSLHRRHIHALAQRVVLHLVALDLGHAEIMRIRVGQVEARDR